MKVGNKDTDSDFTLACMICGGTNELHKKAFRNKHENITGFIVSCNKCDLKDTEIGLWDSKTGKARI